MFEVIFKEIKAGYNQSWRLVKYPFQFTDFAKLLMQDSIPSAWDFYKTYLSSRMSTQLWFASRFQSDYTSGMFNHMTKVLLDLKKVGLLNENTCNIVAGHKEPYLLIGGFERLKQAGILTPGNFCAFASHANPKKMTTALSYLKDAGILTHEVFKVVASHPDPESLALLLSSLQDAGIVISEYTHVISPRFDPSETIEMVRLLQSVQLLTQGNFNAVAYHANLDMLWFTLLQLGRATILTQENLNAVASHAKIENLGELLLLLVRAEILNQTNFDNILLPRNLILMTERTARDIWSRIPTRLLTQANFERLLTAVENANPQQALEQARDQILRMPAEANMAAVAAAFNPGQSTHTASIHRTASASAKKLNISYSHDLNIEKKIKEIKAYVHGLGSSFKNEAAKRCIERITAADYRFIDKTSSVSIRELLALAWVALHDDLKRKGDLQDARSYFVEGFYEIQRGYNQNVAGLDNNQPQDNYICTSGTFNKIIEKLAGIHQDVELEFITQETAAGKLFHLAEQHTIEYLKALASQDRQSANKLIQELGNAENLEPIWDLIKDKVQDELWSEYSEAYAGNPQNQKFLDLISYGAQRGIPDENILKRILAPTQVNLSMFSAASVDEKKEETENHQYKP